MNPGTVSLDHGLADVEHGHDVVGEDDRLRVVVGLGDAGGVDHDVGLRHADGGDRLAVIGEVRSQVLGGADPGGPVPAGEQIGGHRGVARADEPVGDSGPDLPAAPGDDEPGRTCRLDHVRLPVRSRAESR
jgi:hypothetical protein